MESGLCLNMDYIDHIEIIRGPSSSMYGNNAMMNVFNIITKKGGALNQFDVNATYGSFNKREVSTLWGKKYKSGLEMSVGAIASKTDGPDLYFEEIDTSETNNGISKGMDWEKYYGIYSTIGYKNVNLNLSFTSREKSVPTGSYGADLNGENTSSDRHYFAEAKYSTPKCKEFSFNIRSYIDGYLYKGITPNEGILDFAKTDGNWAGTELQSYLKLNNRIVITCGSEYKYNWHAANKEWDNEQTYSSFNKKYSIFSLYAQSETEILKNIFFTAGLRFDKYSYVAPAVSPRLSLVYNLKPNSTFKLLFGHAFRAPNVYQILNKSEDVHNHNSGLKPERNIMYELAFEHRLNQVLATSASVYHYKFKNLIDLYPDRSDGVTRFRNIGLIKGYGFEAGIQLKTHKTNGYLNFSLQKSVDQKTDLLLSNSPKFIFKTGISQQLFSFLKISPEFFYESGRITVYRTKSSPVFYSNINFSTKQFYNHFDLSFKVRNVFNQEYGYPGGFEHVQDVIIQDGINFAIQLNATF
jgi:outer membrane receptor for ferrienterochelin and colicin